MAVELGQRIVKDTIAYNDYAIGISLPIQITNTAFNQTFQTAEQLKSNIKNLLLTKRGERIMQPLFGSGLNELLFEFNDSDLETRIEATINEAVETWMPFVTVDSVEIEASDELKDRNTINVSLKFSVNGNPQLNEVTFAVSAG
jgi:phage baseplate assembly protein W